MKPNRGDSLPLWSPFSAASLAHSLVHLLLFASRFADFVIALNNSRNCVAEAAEEFYHAQ